MKNSRRPSNAGEAGVELQNIETVNGNPKITEDKKATDGGDGEDLVDNLIPGKNSF